MLNTLSNAMTLTGYVLIIEGMIALCRLAYTRTFTDRRR